MKFILWFAIYGFWFLVFSFWFFGFGVSVEYSRVHASCPPRESSLLTTQTPFNLFHAALLPAHPFEKWPTHTVEYAPFIKSQLASRS